MADVLTLSRPAPRPPKQPNLSARLLRHCIDTVTLAGRPLSLGLLLDVLASVPKSREELADDAWAAQSVCWRCVNEIEFRLDAGLIAEEEYYRIADFWVKDFAGQDAALRSNVMVLLVLLKEAFNQ